MRRRRVMRCDRGLRKSILVAFSGGYPGEAAKAGPGYGDSDRETQALDSSGPGASPPFGNLADCRRWHKRSEGRADDIAKWDKMRSRGVNLWVLRRRQFL